MLVVLLMLIPLIFGSIELARAVAIHSALDSGTEIATRAVSLDPSSPQIAWAYGVVDSTVKSNIMGTSGLNPTITVTPVDLNGQDVSLQSLRFGDPFCLRSAAIFTPSIPFIAPQTITIRVEHCAIMEGVLN